MTRDTSCFDYSDYSKEGSSTSVTPSHCTLLDHHCREKRGRERERGYEGSSTPFKRPSDGRVRKEGDSGPLSSIITVHSSLVFTKVQPDALGPLS